MTTSTAHGTSADTSAAAATDAHADGDGAHIDALPRTLATLRAAWQRQRPSAEQRREDLARLRSAFTAGTDAMLAAVGADFGHRSRHETLIADAMTVTSEIDHLRSHLRGWMKPRRAAVGWKLWPARAQLRPVPVGVVGVMSPWNYPVNLALIPLATAIAAGNHVYLKPSEHTPHTSAWLQALLAEVFPPDRVAVVQGDGAVGAAFAGLPFDHLVFTGSTAVGRKVMAAAAANLTPLTLELGGKSPAIVDAEVSVAQVAARLSTGKWFNAGQTCIAPDYVLVHHAQRDALVAALRAQAQTRYGVAAGASDDAIATNGSDIGARDAAQRTAQHTAHPDLTRIINPAQYARLRGYLDDARARGLEVIELVAITREHADAQRLIAPTLVLEPDDDAALMREEIFGPILPIKSWRTLDEAIAYVLAHDRPLALYPFSQRRATVEAILAQVVAGGVTVNDTLFHFSAQDLPFGGIGASGMGAYHARAGFDAMSHAMPVLHQARLTATDLLKPPYRGVVDRLVRRLAGR